MTTDGDDEHDVVDDHDHVDDVDVDVDVDDDKCNVVQKNGSPRGRLGTHPSHACAHAWPCRPEATQKGRDAFRARIDRQATANDDNGTRAQTRRKLNKRAIHPDT